MPNYSWGSNKTANDPCPAGWRIPDGGENGIWAKALGSNKAFTDGSLSNGNGLNFSGKFGSDSIISYPAAGYRSDSDGSLLNVGSHGRYWSVTPDQYYYAYYLHFRNDGHVDHAYYLYGRGYGYSVRCVRE